MCTFGYDPPKVIHRFGKNDDGILAWKSFTVREMQPFEVYLRSPVMGTVWCYKTLTNYGRLTRPCGRSKQLNGIYSWKELTTAKFSKTCVALVRLYGEVHEYPRSFGKSGGYRSKYCEIVAIFVDDFRVPPSRQRKLAARYKVPVLPMSKARASMTKGGSAWSL